MTNFDELNRRHFLARAGLAAGMAAAVGRWENRARAAESPDSATLIAGKEPDPMLRADDVVVVQESFF